MSANRRTFSNSGVRGVGDGISLWRGPFDILTPPSHYFRLKMPTNRSENSDCRTNRRTRYGSFLEVSMKMFRRQLRNWAVVERGKTNQKTLEN